MTHDDADEMVGTIACDDAIGFDPLPLLRALDDNGVPVVIIGQVAGILHGSTELTGDLDLLWSGRPTEAPAMAAAFAAVKADIFDDDQQPFGSPEEPFTQPKFQFRSRNASGDCCTPDLPWGALDVGGFMERAESCVVDGVRLRYLTRADLNAMRTAVGRPKDLRRVAELEELHG